MKASHRVLHPHQNADIPKGLCALAIMTKAPRAGQVKTRLTPPLTAEEAAALNTCFLRDMAAAIAGTASEGLAQGIAVYTPVGAERNYVGIVPAEFALLPQRGEAFGERLICAIEDLFSLGFESVCLINSDSPTVPQQVFAQAARILSEREDPLVLGPSDDGGYYLIGLKKMHRALFENMEWSTARVLEQTISRAQEMELEIHLLPGWYDVDDRAALRRLCREFFTIDGSPPEAYPAPATRAYLNELLQKEGRERIWPNEETQS